MHAPNGFQYISDGSTAEHLHTHTYIQLICERLNYQVRHALPADPTLHSLIPRRSCWYLTRDLRAQLLAQENLHQKTALRTQTKTAANR